MQRNRKITLANRPPGLPSEADFHLVEEPLPEPAEGECLVKGFFLSVDPYMRGRMRDRKSYAPPVRLGEVMTGGVVGKVVKSRSPEFQPGDIVRGQLGWQEYAAVRPSLLERVDPQRGPLSTALGVLGMPGMTAYFGMTGICAPKPEETVAVSGAAGAVGAAAGQIARIFGARVIGIAGSQEKVRHLIDDLGFDAALNYRSPDLGGQLARVCPEGIDAYFDNVGGAVTDAVVANLAVNARIAICGQISQYNLEEPEQGPRWLMRLIVHRARVEGFLVFDYYHRSDEALRRLSRWVADGRLRYRETIAEGIENAPRAFIEMLTGKNIGKQLVKLSQE